MGLKCVGARRFKSQKAHSIGVYMRYVLYSSVNDPRLLAANSHHRKASVRRFRGFSKSWSDSLPNTGKLRLFVCDALMAPRRSRSVLPYIIMSANPRPRPGFRFHGVLGPQKRRG